jgi:hypothetical protein
MSVPSFLSISGSPVTGSGTLAVSLSGTALPIGNGGTAVTSVTTAPTASAFAGWDANKNFSATGFIGGYTTTATAAGTTTLTVGSNQVQFFTGTTTQTVALPVASTLVLGQTFLIVNRSTGVVTVQSSGANSIQAMAASTQLLVTCILASGTGTASWDPVYASNALASGGSGANTALSNLASVAVSASLVPGTDNSIAIGSNGTTGRYTSGYFSTNVSVGQYPFSSGHTYINLNPTAASIGAGLEAYESGGAILAAFAFNGSDWIAYDQSNSHNMFLAGAGIFNTYNGASLMTSTNPSGSGGLILYNNIGVAFGQTSNRSTGTLTFYSNASNGTTGTCTLSSGACTVANTSVDANSEVFLTVKTPGGTQTTAPYISSFTSGTGFNISAGAADTSVVWYEIHESK